MYLYIYVLYVSNISFCNKNVAIYKNDYDGPPS